MVVKPSPRKALKFTQDFMFSRTIRAQLNKIISTVSNLLYSFTNSDKMDN